MIESLHIRNFKSIKDKKFDLRNLNILLGFNGQGKSSFIQSLLLLRQSEKLEQGELALNGGSNGLVNIGTTKDALYQYSEDKILSFDIKFHERELIKMSFDYEIDADIFRMSGDIDYNIKRRHDESLFSNNFQYLNAQHIEPEYGNKTSLSSVKDENSIGKHGEYTAHYIALRGNEDVVFDNVLHKDSSYYDAITSETNIDRSLRNQINLWLGEISPGVKVIARQIDPNMVLLEYNFEQPSYGSTNRFMPENVGFGISYALHVVTALLIAKPKSLIIIENPESHIHPRGQAELGKLIAKVAENDVQVIIETHSDHILNGIRVAVKESTIDKERVVAYYFNKRVEEQEQYSEITAINIDRNGSLSKYPENLLDEWSNQISKLI